MQDFARNTELTTALAVVLNFSLGLRVGELVALKWKDLKGSYLHIRRMEQKQYEQLEGDKWHYHIEVVAHTKSDAGYRQEVYALLQGTWYRQERQPQNPKNLPYKDCRQSKHQLKGRYAVWRSS